MHTDVDTRTGASKEGVLTAPEQGCLPDALSGSSLNAITDFKQIRSLNSLCRNFSVFMIATDIRGMIRLTSSNAQLLPGFNPSELQGANIRALFEDETGRINDIMAHLEAEEELENLEMVRKRKNGRRLRVSISASLLISKNRQRLGAVFILRDIAGKKMQEE